MDDRILAIVASTFNLDPADVPADASPENITAWDSLTHMQFILALEEELGVQFSPEQITAMLSLDAVKAAVRDVAGSQER